MLERGHFRQNTTFKVMVLLCAILVGAALSAQAFHFHPDGNPGNEKHCSICSGAHFAMPVVHTHVTSAHTTTTAPGQARPIQVSVRHLPFSLFNRPPPSLV